MAELKSLIKKNSSLKNQIKKCQDEMKRKLEINPSLLAVPDEICQYDFDEGNVFEKMIDKLVHNKDRHLNLCMESLNIFTKGVEQLKQSINHSAPARKRMKLSASSVNNSNSSHNISIGNSYNISFIVFDDDKNDVEKMDATFDMQIEDTKTAFLNQTITLFRMDQSSFSLNDQKIFNKTIIKPKIESNTDLNKTITKSSTKNCSNLKKIEPTAKKRTNFNKTSISSIKSDSNMNKTTIESCTKIDKNLDKTIASHMSRTRSDTILTKTVAKRAIKTVEKTPIKTGASRAKKTEESIAKKSTKNLKKIASKTTKKVNGKPDLIKTALNATFTTGSLSLEQQNLTGNIELIDSIKPKEIDEDVLMDATFTVDVNNQSIDKISNDEAKTTKNEENTLREFDLFLDHDLYVFSDAQQDTHNANVNHLLANHALNETSHLSPKQTRYNLRQSVRSVKKNYGC